MARLLDTLAWSGFILAGLLMLLLPAAIVAIIVNLRVPAPKRRPSAYFRTGLGCMIQSAVFILSIPIMIGSVAWLKIANALGLKLNEGSWMERRLRRIADAPPYYSGRAPMDAAAWDGYWIEGDGRGERGFGYSVLPYVWDLAREGRVRNALFVGNGISREPFLFSAVGIESAALDVSPTAVSRFAAAGRRPLDLASRLDEFVLFDGRVKEQARAKLKEAPDSPQVRAETGDFRDPSILPGPYDLVVARRVLQFHDQDPESVRATAECLIARLGPNGILIADFINAPGQCASYRKSLIELGCREIGGEEWQGIKPMDGRAFAAILVTG